jgi:hypothetical protein
MYAGLWTITGSLTRVTCRSASESESEYGDVSGALGVSGGSTHVRVQVRYVGVKC